MGKWADGVYLCGERETLYLDLKMGGMLLGWISLVLNATKIPIRKKRASREQFQQKKTIQCEIVSKILHL